MELGQVITDSLTNSSVLNELGNLIASRLGNRTVELIDYGSGNGQQLCLAILLTAQPLTHERLELSYAEGGPALPPFQRVYSVGLTPIAAIHSLGLKIGWGKLDDFVQQDVDKPDECWYFSFTSDGTSMKAAGRFVPGGVVLDWWK